MGGFRIGRNRAAHSYPDAPPAAGASRSQSILFFGAPEISDNEEINQLLPPGFGPELPASSPADIPMPFDGGAFTVLRVLQNIPGIQGTDGTIAIKYTVIRNGIPLAASSVTMAPGDSQAFADFNVPYVEGDHVGILVQVTGTVGIGGQMPTNVEASLAYTAPLL